MKKLILVISVVLSSVVVYTQAPEKMSFQAVVRDASNALVSEEVVGIQISILQGSMSGPAVYTETHSPMTNTNGLASLEIGSGNIVSGTFSSIDWSNGPFFIQTEIDPTGGTSYSVVATSQLMSVPYALYAKTAGTSHWLLNNNDVYYDQGNVGIGTSSPSSPLEILGNNTDSDGNITDALVTIQNNNYSRYRAASFSNTSFRNSQVQGIRGRGTVDSPQDVLPGDRVFGTYSNVYANGGFSPSPIASVEHYVGEVPASGILTFSTLSPNQFLREERLRINEYGNVGIGTVTPNSKLEVLGDNTDSDGNITDALITIQNNNYSRYRAASFSNTSFRNSQVQGIRGRGTVDNPQDVMPGDRVFGTYSQVYTNGGFLPSPIASVEHYVGEGSASGILTFSTLSPNQTIREERLRIDEYGNVGLGTDQPSTSGLHIRKFNATIRLEDTDVLAGDVYQLTNNTQGNDVLNFAIYNKTDERAELSFDGSGSLSILNGNLGIGTDQATTKVQVAGGDVYIQDINSGIIMKSPNGQCWRMTVDNSGNPVFTMIPCP